MEQLTDAIAVLLSITTSKRTPEVERPHNCRVGAGTRRKEREEDGVRWRSVEDVRLNCIATPSKQIGLPQV